MAGLALAGVSAGEGAAQSSSSGLKFGTGGEGGGFVVYGSAFVDAIKWANPKIAIRPLPSRGSVENVLLLEAGTIDIGLVFGEMAQELFNHKDRPPTQLKVISVAYSSPGMFVVRADTRYWTIADLKGRPVVWNSRGSGLAVQGRYVVEALGLHPERDFDAIYTERLTDGPAMILEGRAAALWGAGNRWPGFVKIANDPRGARFITPTEEQIAGIVARYPFMRRLSIPAARYPGQSEPLLTVGSWSYVLARTDLAEAVGYDLTAALHKAERIGNMFGDKIGESTVRNTLKALPRQDALHPGAERYLREAGLIK
jgi:TRAP transporter TAXI family solute receptor